MAANSTLQSPVPATAPPVAHRALKLSEGSPRLGGFDNLLRKELGDWFHTRRWWKQALLWLGIVNLLVGFILFLAPSMTPEDEAGGSSPVPPPGEMGVQLVLSFIVLGGSIGTMVLAQDEIVGEKLSGTAAWILSKPAARASFILAKLVANTIGILVFIVLIPAVVGFFEVWIAAARAPALLPYLTGLGAAALALLFYLTLSIMLGVLFEGRGGVIGVCLAILLGGTLAINFTPIIASVLPVAMHQISPALALGQPVPQVGWMEIISTAVWCVLFVIVALWRFEKLEL